MTETQKLSEVASLTNNFIIITDTTGIIEWTNSAFLERNEFDSVDVVGRNLTDLLVDSKVQTLWKSCLFNQEGFYIESIGCTSQGEEYPIMMEVQASQNQEKVRNYFIVQTDISDAKQAEIALRNSQQQLKNALAKERELNQLKSQFVSMTSHEFRTPLTVISAASQSLFEFYEKMSSIQRSERIQRINNQIEHLTSMLDDVLLINQIEEGQLSLNLERFSLPAYFSEIVKEIKSTQTTHVLVFDCKVEQMHITADKKLLRQIFTNLVSNAIKYSEAESNVFISLDCVEEMAVLTVRDEGIGIPFDSYDDLFNSFHRASNVGNIKGTGLGLKITKRAVDMHNGSIEFDSKIDQGTTFTIQIPLNLTTGQNR